MWRYHNKRGKNHKTYRYIYNINDRRVKKPRKKRWGKKGEIENDKKLETVFKKIDKKDKITDTARKELKAHEEWTKIREEKEKTTIIKKKMENIKAPKIKKKKYKSK